MNSTLLSHNQKYHENNVINLRINQLNGRFIKTQTYNKSIFIDAFICMEYNVQIPLMSSRRQSKSFSKRISFSSNSGGGLQSLASKSKQPRNFRLSQTNSQTSSIGQGMNRSKNKTFTKVKTKKTFIPPKYPAIIVTSDFDASYIADLSSTLDQKFIPVHMQSSRKKVKKSADVPTDRYFIIVDQTKGEQLKGQFLEIQNAIVVKYPKSTNKEEILKLYSKQFGLGNYKQQKESQDINQYGQFDNNKLVDKVQQDLPSQANPYYKMSNSYAQGIPLSGAKNKTTLASAALISSQLPTPNISTSVSAASKALSTQLDANKKAGGIRLKTITKFNAQEIIQKSQRDFNNQMAVFIIYENQHQSKRYKNYISSLRDKGEIVEIQYLKKMNIKRRQLIRVHLIDQYQRILKAVSAQQEGKKIKIYKYVLMGEYSAKKFTSYFKKADEIYVLCDRQKACVKTMRDRPQDNITNATIDIDEMDNLIREKNFFRNGETLQTPQQPYFLRMYQKGNTLVQKRASSTSMSLDPKMFQNRQNQLQGSYAKSIQSDYSPQQSQVKVPKKFGSEKGKQTFVGKGKPRKVSGINIKYPKQPQLKHYHMPEPINQKVVKFADKDKKYGLDKVSEEQQQSRSRNQQVPSPDTKNQQKAYTVFAKNRTLAIANKPNKVKNEKNKQSQNTQSEQSQSQKQSQQDRKSSSQSQSQSQETDQAMKVSVMNEQYCTQSFQSSKQEKPVKLPENKSQQNLIPAKVTQQQNSGHLTYKTTEKSKNCIISRPSLGSVNSNSLIGILAGNLNNDDYERYDDVIKQSHSINLIKPNPSNKSILRGTNSLKTSNVQMLLPSSDKEKQLVKQNLKLKLQKIAIEQKLQEQQDKERQQRKQLKLSQVKQMEQRQNKEKQKQNQIQSAIEAIEKKQKQLEQKNGAEKAQRDALEQQKQRISGQLKYLKKQLEDQTKKRKQRQNELQKQKQELQKQMQKIKQQNNAKNKQFQQRQKQLKEQIERQRRNDNRKLQNQLQKISRQNEKRRMSNQMHKGQLQKLRKQLENKQIAKQKQAQQSQKHQRVMGQDERQRKKQGRQIPKNNSQTSEVKNFLLPKQYYYQSANQLQQQQVVDDRTRGCKKDNNMPKPIQQEHTEIENCDKNSKHDSKKISNLPISNRKSSQLTKQRANLQAKQSPKKLKNIACRPVEQYRINQSQISFDSQSLKNNFSQKAKNQQIKLNSYFPKQLVQDNYGFKNPKDNQNIKFTNNRPLLNAPTTQPANSNPWFKRSFNNQMQRNRSTSEQKHRNLSPFGINLDHYDKFIQNGVTVYRKKPDLISNVPFQQPQRKQVLSQLPKKQIDNKNRSKQKQQFLRKNSNYFPNKIKNLKTAPLAIQNMSQSKRHQHKHPRIDVPAINKQQSIILSARPQNNYFFDQTQKNKDYIKNNVPLSQQKVRNANYKYINRGNKNDRPDNDRTSKLNLQYQINDTANKQNRSDYSRKRPPSGIIQKNKSNDKNVLTERNSINQLTPNNKHQSFSNLQKLIKNKNNTNKQSKFDKKRMFQQNPRIEYLIPRNQENSNFAIKLRTQLGPQDALYSYINPRHLMNQISQADQIYDIIFIFEDRDTKFTSEINITQGKNCYFANIDKSKTSKVDGNRVTANSTSDLPIIANNLHNGIFNARIPDKNKNKDRKEFLCLYKLFNNQYRSLAEKLVGRLSLEKQKQTQMKSYFIPQQAIKFIFEHNGASKNTTIITDEVGLDDLVNKVLLAIKGNSSSKTQLINILVIPKGQYYQYSYQRFCGMQIQDLNELGICINWITKAELEDINSNDIDLTDKLYKSLEQSELIN